MKCQGNFLFLKAQLTAGTRKSTAHPRYLAAGLPPLLTVKVLCHVSANIQVSPVCFLSNPRFPRFASSHLFNLPPTAFAGISPFQRAAKLPFLEHLLRLLGLWLPGESSKFWLESGRRAEAVPLRSVARGLGRGRRLRPRLPRPTGAAPSGRCSSSKATAVSSASEGATHHALVQSPRGEQGRERPAADALGGRTRRALPGLSPRSSAPLRPALKASWEL